MQKVVLDIDDSTIYFVNWDKLFRLKDRYPGMKVTFFHIPYDVKSEKGNVHTLREMSLKKLKENLDWIQLVPHGICHFPNEFLKADKETCQLSLKAIGEFFKEDELPYEKGFKAPQWLYNQDLVDVLDEEEWWLGVDRNQPLAPRTKKYYEYSHSIEENFWESSEDVWKLHAHMGGPSTNNLEDCFLNLLKIPLDAEWHFATDFISSSGNVPRK